MNEIFNLDDKSLPVDKVEHEKLDPADHWLRTFFSSPTEPLDAAVILALNDGSLDEELETITAYYEEKKAALSSFYAPRLQSLKEHIATRQKWLENKLLAEISLRQDLENLKEEKNGLTIRIKESTIKRQLAWQRILKDRFERVRSFLNDRELRILNELHQSRQEVLNDADNQIDYLRKFYDLILGNRKEHADHISARAEDCVRRQKEIEGQVEVAQAEARKLREIGVTEYSATFLLMFGVFALAGAGSAAASLLSSRQPGNSIFALLLGNLLDALDHVPAPWGSIAKFVALLGAPIVGISLLFAAFVFFVKIAMRLAGDYDPSLRSGNSKTDRKLQVNDEWGGAPIISYIKRLTSQFPGMDGFRADRRSYGQMIAYFPYLMLVFIGLFLFSGIAVEGTKVNLTVILIGMAMALLSATSALLYVTYVIQPRWRAAVEQYNTEKPSKGFLMRYILLNIEFLALLALLVGALLVAAFLPPSSPVAGGLAYFSDGQVKLISWGMVTIFMLLASFGLAYGIVQKGIFHEVRDLLRKHKIFQNCIERYKYPPLIEDLGYPERVELEKSLDTFIKRQDSLNEIRSSYELSQIFSPEEEVTIVEQENRARWPRWLRRFVRYLLAREKIGLDLTGLPTVKPTMMMLKPIDYLDSKEAVEEYELSELELGESGQRNTTLTNMAAELERSLQDLQKEIRELVLDIEKFKNQWVEAEEQLTSTASRVSGNLRRDEYEFKKAFSVGQRLRKVVADEPMSPDSLS